MKTRQLTEYLRSQFAGPGQDFERKLHQLYFYIMGKYEDRYDAINPTIIRKLTDKIYNLSALFMTIPPDVRDTLPPLSFLEMRCAVLIKLANCLTKLYCLDDIDIPAVNEKICATLGEDKELIWTALAKSHLNTQPYVFERLIFEAAIMSNSLVPPLYEYGCLMLCLALYRCLTIEKVMEFEITAHIKNVIVPYGMVTLLKNLMPLYPLNDLTDANLSDSVYSLCGHYTVLQVLNNRFGPLYPLNFVSNQAIDLSQRTRNDSGPGNDSGLHNGQPTASPPRPTQSVDVEIPFIGEKDPLVINFMPPRSYQEVKTFVYVYGSRLLTAEDKFVRQLQEKVMKYHENAPLSFQNCYAHNFMAIYMRIIGTIRRSHTVNPVLAKVIRVSRYTDFRGDIELSYMNDQKICEKLRLRKAVGLYCKGADKPSILGIIVKKSKYFEETKRAKAHVIARRIVVRGKIPRDLALNPNDSIGLTELIDIEQNLAEANMLCRRLSGQPPKRKH